MSNVNPLNFIPPVHPVLYSYRRCPFAMRARMGIWAAGIEVEQREIVFWDKPEPMLQASPKGTVPVLVLPSGKVIDESWDILVWALQQQDPKGWYHPSEQAAEWIEQLEVFKPLLDDYKYHEDRSVARQARAQAEASFLQNLEQALSTSPYVQGAKLTHIDIAIFPFIRQFAFVDKDWWQTQPFPAVEAWLQSHLQADYFRAIMKKRPVWQISHQPLWVDEPLMTTRDQFVKKAQKLDFK